MPWRYEQSTGQLLHRVTDVVAWANVWKGYSGHGVGVNNPEYESEPNVGPIPLGRYRIGLPYHHPKLGPVTMNLDPLPGTNTLGRSAFRVHGDDKDPAINSGSRGCVVLPRPVREQIATAVQADDHVLEVVRG